MEGGLIGVVVNAVMRYLQRGGMQQADFDVNSGHATLEYGLAFRGLSWFFLWVGIAIGWLGAALPRLLSTPPPTGGDFWGLLVLFLGFALIGAALVHESHMKIVLDGEKIVAHSPWRGEVRIQWAAVESLRYSPMNQWFVIRGRLGSVIRIQNFLNGIPTFEQFCHAKLDPGVYTNAFTKYAEQTHLAH